MLGSGRQTHRLGYSDMDLRTAQVSPMPHGLFLTPDRYWEDRRAASACQVDRSRLPLYQPPGPAACAFGRNSQRASLPYDLERPGYGLPVGFAAFYEDSVRENLHEPAGEFASPLTGGEHGLTTRHHREHHRQIERVHVICGNDQGACLWYVLASSHIHTGHDAKERARKPVPKAVVDGQPGAIGAHCYFAFGTGVGRRRPSTVTRWLLTGPPIGVS